MKFCILFKLSPCPRYCLLIGSQLTTYSQGNLHYIRLHFFQLDQEFFCLLPSLARLYSAAASPSERLRSYGSLAMNINKLLKHFTLIVFWYERHDLLSSHSNGDIFTCEDMKFSRESSPRISMVFFIGPVKKLRSCHVKFSN